MQFTRRIYPKLIAQIDQSDIVVLTGMRRTGKTTLLRMVYDAVQSKNKVFLDMDNPLERRIFEQADFNNIWPALSSYGIDKTQKAYIFLDEIQSAPEVVKAAKYLYDHYGAKFFLTGSSSFYLKNLFGESLSGRKALYELFPLDFEEFLLFRGAWRKSSLLSEVEADKNPIGFEKLRPLYEEYLTFGGFPQVVLEANEEKKLQWLSDIFKSYFEKDVKALADFHQMNKFRDLILLLAARVGGKIEVSKLASAMSLNRETVYSYLGFLEKTYFIHLISPHTRSADREVSLAKKVYLCDVGMARFLRGASDGSLFENSVYLNLRKYEEPKYYQRRGGFEIDFILPSNGIGIEVKQSAGMKEVANMKKRAGPLGLKKLFITTQNYHEESGIVPALYL